MITEDQTEVVTFLGHPPRTGRSRRAHRDPRVDRHFAGARALKRAVQYDYLDFSTIERRKAMCDAEA